MLVLGRKLFEEIVIVLESGELIIIAPQNINPKKVRIGVDAPAAVKVYRKEVYDKILRQQQELPNFEKRERTLNDELQLCEEDE